MGVKHGRQRRRDGGRHGRTSGVVATLLAAPPGGVLRGRQDGRAVEVAILQWHLALLLIELAEDPVGRGPDISFARHRHVRAVEARRLAASPADQATHVPRGRLPVGHAPRRGVEADLRREVLDERAKGLLGVPAVLIGLPRGEAVEPGRIGQGAAEVVNDAGEEDPDTLGALGGDLRVALRGEGNLGRVRHAERVPVQARAPHGLGHQCRHGAVLVHHRREAPAAEVVAVVVKVPKVVAAQAEHAELRLRAALVVTNLELEEGGALQKGRVLRDLQDRVQVLVRVLEGRVVLHDDHGSGREVLLVGDEEILVHILGRGRRVERVHPPVVVRLRQVVLRRVAVPIRVQHRRLELAHLSEPRLPFEGLAIGADAKGKSSREVHKLTGHPHLLLGLQHAVEGTDDGLRELPGLMDVRYLQVRLVDDDHRGQGWVVILVARHETLQQVEAVHALDEVGAIKVVVQAVLSL
mmetsp:Transcript_138485/g.430641  ORF Transcript_138485/g.430641 Transcript_138485/m.430641 type:complete len:467 (-) Transcript_138485:371-1771(-)